MKNTEFSKKCRFISNFFLFFAIVGSLVIALWFGRVPEYEYSYKTGEELVEYVRDWKLTIIFFVSLFVSSYIIHVVFGAIYEHLVMMYDIVHCLNEKKKINSDGIQERGEE